MEFHDFQQKLMDDLWSHYEGQNRAISFDSRPVPKLQGESYYAIIAYNESNRVGVSVNASALHDKLLKGASYDNLLQEAISQVEDDFQKMPVVSAEDLTEYARIRTKLSVQLLPQAGNEGTLGQIPHKNVEDMAVVYRAILSEDDEGRATVLINNDMLNMFGVTPEQLHEDAIAASMEQHPAIFRNMNEILSDMIGIDPTMLPPSPLHCASTADKFMGAGVILYPGFLDMAAEQMGENFYVLPSSIHEVLAISDSHVDSYHDLENMVREINQNEVAPADQLSQNVYHYDAEAKVFELASKYEDRILNQQAVQDTIQSEEATPTMTVLLVKPNQYPQIVEMETGLESLQQAVGGFIECVYPFEESVGIVCNEEGKLENLPLNRALRDDDGHIYDVIAGDFLVVGLNEDDFGSLTPEQIKQFEGHFHQPEAFVRTGKGIIVVPMPDEAVGEKVKPAVEKAKDQLSL